MPLLRVHSAVRGLRINEHFAHLKAADLSVGRIWAGKFRQKKC